MYKITLFDNNFFQMRICGGKSINMSELYNIAIAILIVSSTCNDTVCRSVHCHLARA